MGSPDLTSPSPARSVSDAEFANIAHLALSGAKERKTPATSPSPSTFNVAADEFVPCQLNFEEPSSFNVAADEFVPRQLTFEGCDGILSDAKLVEPLKVQTSRLNLLEIPSPTRNCRQKNPWIADRGDEAQQTTFGSCVEDAWQKLAEKEVKSETFANDSSQLAEGRNKESSKQEIEEAQQMAEMDRMCV